MIELYVHVGLRYIAWLKMIDDKTTQHYNSTLRIIYVHIKSLSCENLTIHSARIRYLYPEVGNDTAVGSDVGRAKISLFWRIP